MPRLSESPGVPLGRTDLAVGPGPRSPVSGRKKSARERDLKMAAVMVALKSKMARCVHGQARSMKQLFEPEKMRPTCMRKRKHRL